MSDTDILVIGGGAIGICSVYYLVQQGLQALVVKQGEIASGFSGANAGRMVSSYFAIFSVSFLSFLN